MMTDRLAVRQVRSPDVRHALREVAQRAAKALFQNGVVERHGQHVSDRHLPFDREGQQMDQVLRRSNAREALNKLDAEIERREQALRENWAEMSDAARETARARLQDLREARNRLGERYGALQTGTSDAWDELKTGFSDSWTAFSDAWSAADEEAPAN